MSAKTDEKQQAGKKSKAKSDAYLKVEKMRSDKTEADPKLQKDAPDIMAKAAREAIASAKGITTVEPKEDGAKGYTISGNLTKLTKETKGNDDIYSCVVSMVLAEWPTDKILAAKLEGKTKVSAQAGASEKRARKDAEACIAGATQGAVETAIKWINSQ
jgi:hypothetical protein